MIFVTNHTELSGTGDTRIYKKAYTCNFGLVYSGGLKILDNKLFAVLGVVF